MLPASTHFYAEDPYKLIVAVGTDKQAEETKKFIAEMEEDIIPIDGTCL